MTYKKICVMIKRNKIITGGKSMIKQNVNINIRVSQKLREKFLEVCQQQGIHSSKVIRYLMKKFIADKVNEEIE